MIFKIILVISSKTQYASSKQIYKKEIFLMGKKRTSADYAAELKKLEVKKKELQKLYLNATNQENARFRTDLVNAVIAWNDAKEKPLSREELINWYVSRTPIKEDNDKNSSDEEIHISDEKRSVDDSDDMNDGHQYSFDNGMTLY